MTGYMEGHAAICNVIVICWHKLKKNIVIYLVQLYFKAAKLHGMA